MTIRNFLLYIAIVLIGIGVYFHIQYLQNISFQEKNDPIEDYYIIDKYCVKNTRGGSSVKIGYKGGVYSVSVSRFDCPNITNEYFKGQLYYLENEDDLFYEYDRLPFGVSLLLYIAGIVIPAFAFIVYRKELNNNYKTM